ncbi:MAG TPA: MFS transporter [Gemmatimonadaceae bacterium]|jgi:UMF1 family MFS transporter|nr:MFS transporter [Gemmatimonadaceae bacterium]
MAHASHAQPIPAADGEIAVAAPAPARERWSWALYDFANTIFSMNVATLYFAVWLVSDLGVSNRAVAVGNGISSLLVMGSIPVFGAISDATRRRKPWVVSFTLAACVATAVVGIIGQTMVPPIGDEVVGGALRTAAWHLSTPALFAILATFVIANYAYQGALPFYNAMLPELVPQREMGRLSGLGTALGYVGSIVGVALVKPFFDGSLPGVKLPEGVVKTLRGVVPFTAHGGRVATFLPTALLFFIFSIPLMLFCRDHLAGTVQRTRVKWREAFADVARTVRDARKHPGALRFILASFLYQDAMGTIISFMALYAVVAMGFAAGSEVTLFLVLTVPAVIGSYLSGLLTDRIGPKKTLMLVIVAWVVLLTAMILAPSQRAFWVVGFFIGLIYGGVSTAERPLLLSLVPDVEAGRYFGLMVLSARAAAVLGPFVWAFAVDGLTPVFNKGIAYRAAVATVGLAMLIALFVLRKVPDNFARRTAA